MLITQKSMHAMQESMHAMQESMHAMQESMHTMQEFMHAMQGFDLEMDGWIGEGLQAWVVANDAHSGGSGSGIGVSAMLA
jgi:hypothetical protein